MTTEILKKKTGRYLCGQSVRAETMQIQNWLSCIDNKQAVVSAEERTKIENEIAGSVQAYVTSTLFILKPESWWKKMMTF
jgi:ABC-type enterochelin transport system substrate-binding protein